MTKDVLIAIKGLQFEETEDAEEIESFLSDDRKWSLLYKEETGVLVL